MCQGHKASEWWSQLRTQVCSVPLPPSGWVSLGWGRAWGRQLTSFFQRNLWGISLALKLCCLMLHLQFSSVTQSCPTLCDPMDCSTPGFPVHHHLLELAQTYVHQVNNAIQQSHPLSSPSPPAFNLSQHQGLFQRVCFFTSGGQRIGASASASLCYMGKLAI